MIGELELPVPSLLRQDLPAVVDAALRRRGMVVTWAKTESIIPPGANMTTGGLWRIQGMAQQAGSGNEAEPAPFSVIAKLTQSPLLWPGIQAVPPEFREQLAERYPWRTEAQAYAAGVSTALPFNARMPEAFRITELDAQRILIWMEDVDDGGAHGWSDEQFADAAFVLGGLAGSPDVDALVTAVPDATTSRRLEFFLEGVGIKLLIPAIMGDDVWQHPVVAGAADPAVISGLRGLAGRARDLVDVVVALPQFPMHGDASPQNLLAGAANGGDEAFILIDWGNFGRGPAGFDLAQLLAGRVNDGDMPGSDLVRLAPLCVDAYCNGMAEAGTEPDASSVAGGHAAAMAVFTGLSALPLDQLAAPRPGLEDVVAGRLDMVRFILGRLDALGM
ncbi:hypothetical protein QE394_000918 [Arthrobacter sp. SORGH_AS 212]|uniref:phosphotransferase n=1 Tax=Pseudarthrobacter sp. SORGH_AS 212 TaxID=3041777 RepID=UPI002784B0DA|nr:hypothetical protein [Arthrobacter sp. SORGH_AS_0212]